MTLWPFHCVYSNIATSSNISSMSAVHHWITKIEQEAISTLQSSFHFPRVFQCNSTVPVACQGILTSLCSTPLVHSSDAPLLLLTHPVGCLSWASTPLDLTIQYSSPLEPLSPILHSIIRYLVAHRTLDFISETQSNWKTQLVLEIKWKIWCNKYVYSPFSNPV